MDIPPWPYHSPEEIAAASEVLQSGRVNQWTGPEVGAFEEAAGRALGVQNPLAVANGTVALVLALNALGIGPGDDVIVPARTFIATAAAAALVGARPVVADVHDQSGGLTAETVADAMTPATRAVIPVHLGGWPCDTPGIMDLVSEKELFVVEDCAQAHGARIGGQPVGSRGSAATFSFCQDKIISTGGEGGLVATSDKEIAMQIWSNRDHGKDQGETFRDDHAPGFRWLHSAFGTNARMTGFQAAIGRLQMQKLPSWLETRRSNAAALRARLREIRGLRVPTPGTGIDEAPYRVYAFLESDEHHADVVASLAKAGVPGGVGSCGEIYREQAFTRRDWAPKTRLPVAAKLARTSLAFPVHPGMEAAHLEWIADQVEAAMRIS